MTAKLEDEAKRRLPRLSQLHREFMALAKTEDSETLIMALLASTVSMATTLYGYEKGMRILQRMMQNAPRPNMTLADIEQKEDARH